nr:putative protein [Neurospora crassa]
MVAHSSLPSPQDQALMMDTAVLYTAYGIAWLEQTHPSFTTADYALMPFYRADSASENHPGENLTAVTNMLTTELNCWEPIMTELPVSRSYKFDNGQGCTVDVGLFLAPQEHKNESSEVLYMGWDGNAILDYYLESPNCTRKFSNQFLAVYAHLAVSEIGNLEESNVTAIFCETSYFKQPVSVTISAESGRPLNNSIVSMGQKQPLGKDEFNSTALEYLVGVGMPPPTPTRDYPAANTFEPWGSLAEKDVARPVVPMVNIALGLSDDPASDFYNVTTLERVFTAAYKTIFSAAISRLASETRGTEYKTGESHYTLNGVVVSRTISAILEGLLLLLAILMAATLYTSTKAVSKLTADPATLGFALKSVQHSRVVLNRLALEDCADAASLQLSLAGERFFIEKGVTGNNILEMESSSRVDIRTDSRRKETEYHPTRPKELSPLTGCLLVCILLTGVGILIYFKKQEEHLQGLPRPSENFEVLQLLENYIPTIFTTLLEPFLVLMTRLFCILQPFNTLRKGNCNPEKTLETKYTSLPPQLILWRSLRSRDFLLTALCIMSLLVNLLTVALGGTFNELPVQIQYPVTFHAARVPSLSRDTMLNELYLAGKPYQDHFYAAYTNISGNTTLPPWVTTQYTFLPVNEIIQERSGSADLFRANLRGFGTEAKCEPISTSLTAPQAVANITELLRGVPQSGSPGATFNFRHDNGTWQTCFPTSLLWGSNATGISAREVVTPLSKSYGYTYGNIPYENSMCEDRFIVGWLRVDSKNQTESLRSTFLQCQAVMRTAMFDVDFDQSGHILAYSRSGEFDDMTQFMSLNMSQTIVRQANKLVNYNGRPMNDYAWHNATMVADWWNYLMRFKLNSTDLVDPSLDIPKAEDMIPVVQDLYQRLFAILVGKNLDMFQEPSTLQSINGTIIVTETRIFLDNKAYLMSVIILCLTAAVLIWAYLTQSAAYLPRLPSTLGSMLAYTAASRAVREYGDSATSDQESWHQKAPFKPTFSFGKYLGVDGNIHVGIEMDPFVTPIDGTVLRRRTTAKSWFRGKGEE